MCFLAEFVLLALESGPLYLFFVSVFIIIIIYLFIVYVLCDGETQEDWDTLDFMQVTGMIEWGPDKNQSLLYFLSREEVSLLFK